MTKLQTFLIKADNDKETVIRLPVNHYGGMTAKAFKMIRERFYNGLTDTYPKMKYAVNLEAFTNGNDLKKAIEDYQNNEI